MPELSEIFARIQEIKKQQKDIRTAYKDALKTSHPYVEITEELKQLREKKKAIEQGIKDQFSAELMQLEDLSIDLASEMEMLNDLALTKFMKGETLDLEDEYGNNYEPIFSVKFKKS